MKIAESYRLNDFWSAHELAQDHIKNGNQSPQTIYIFCECEMQIGNPDNGFRGFIQLARNLNKIEIIRRLIFWFDKILHGYQNASGEWVVRNFSQNELHEVLKILVSGSRNNFFTSKKEILCEIMQRLGSIGYMIDEAPCYEFSKIAKEIVNAKPIDLESILQISFEHFGSNMNLRWLAHFLSIAGENKFAEDLMAKISTPYCEETDDSKIFSSQFRLERNLSALSYETPQIERTSRRLIDLTGNSFLGDLLDIGCGTGLTSSLVRGRAKSIYGLDIDPEFILAASKKNLFSSLKTIDFFNWDYKGEKFDTIISCMVSVYLPSFDSFIDKIARLLKDNGKAYIDVATCAHLNEVGERVIDDVYLRSRKYVRDMMARRGLLITQEKIGPWGFAVGSYLEISLKK